MLTTTAKISLVALFGLLPAMAALAADGAKPAPMDDQFAAVAAARTHADLAIRKMRSLADENEANWRGMSAAMEVSRGQILEAIRKAVEDESRRSEELRNPAVIEELNQRRATVEQDWQRFAAIERPAIETSYRGAIGSLQSVAQVFATLTNIEPVWKDAKIDLPTLQASYDAVAKRAEDLKAQAEKATADFQANQKLWESTAKAATQPTPSAAPAAKKAN